jgi:hypothetical protein
MDSGPPVGTTLERARLGLNQKCNRDSIRGSQSRCLTIRNLTKPGSTSAIDTEADQANTKVVHSDLEYALTRLDVGIF